MKKNLWKKMGAALLAATMTCGLVACGSGDAPKAESTEASAKELTKITFCLDWTPNTNHTGLYVAAAQGYYEEAGLDVQIVQPPEDGAVLMCASGQAQFAIDAQDTFAAALDQDQPYGVSAIAAVIQHNTSGIISRAGEGLDKPAGLAGKTYSTWESPIEMAMIQNVMEKDGADFSTLKMIPNTITDEPAALAAHQTDAIWVFYGWGGINADIEKVDVDYWNFKDVNPELDYYTPVIVGNDEFMQENPEIAKAFLEATKKGYEYAIENPKEAADMLIAGDTTGSLSGSEELVYASQEWLGEQYKADVDRWGYIDPARWDGFYAWLYNNGLTTKDLSGQGYTNDYLPE
ncbi:MAG: ABC transporter substrate-binding protein [Eubacteriales bacterium]|nr:ABC transporter substrate-binding protein [Eubacteriales bacterium]